MHDAKMIEELADAITDRLMTDGPGGKGTRLAIRQGNGDGTERDLGGMNRACVRREVLRELKASPLLALAENASKLQGFYIEHGHYPGGHGVAICRDTTDAILVDSSCVSKDHAATVARRVAEQLGLPVRPLDPAAYADQLSAAQTAGEVADA